MLHLLSLATLSQALVDRIGDGDDLILQQGCIWCARKGHVDNHLLYTLMAKTCRIYVLKDMLTVYGIDASELLTGIALIDYSDFVNLSVKNPVIQTWC